MIRYHRVHTCAGKAREEAMSLTSAGVFVHLQWHDDRGWVVVSFNPGGEKSEYELMAGEHCYTAFSNILDKHS